MSRKKEREATKRGQHYEKEVVCENTSWAKTKPVSKPRMRRAEKIRFDPSAGITGPGPSDVP